MFFRFLFILSDTFLTVFVGNGYLKLLFGFGFVQFENSRLFGCFSISIYFIVVILLFLFFYFLLNLPQRFLPSQTQPWKMPLLKILSGKFSIHAVIPSVTGTRIAKGDIGSSG